MIYLIIFLCYLSCFASPIFKGLENHDGYFIWKETPSIKFYIFSLIWLVILFFHLYLLKVKGYNKARMVYCFLSILVLYLLINSNFLSNNVIKFNDENIISKEYIPLLLPIEANSDTLNIDNIIYCDYWNDYSTGNIEEGILIKDIFGNEIKFPTAYYQATYDERDMGIIRRVLSKIDSNINFLYDQYYNVDTFQVQLLKSKLDDKIINDINHWMNKAKRFSNSEKYVINCYNKVTEINPNYYEAWFYKGKAYHKLCYFEEAIKSYNEALRIKPNTHECWYNLGNSYLKIHEKNKAIESYKKAIKIKPDNSESLYKYSSVLSSWMLKEIKEKDRYLKCKGDVLKSLKLAIKFNKDYKNKARDDLAFEVLFDDSDFKRIVK